MADQQLVSRIAAMRAENEQLEAGLIDDAQMSVLMDLWCKADDATFQAFASANPTEMRYAMVVFRTRLVLIAAQRHAEAVDE
jgi:hypothetical protein